MSAPEGKTDAPREPGHFSIRSSHSQSPSTIALLSWLGSLGRLGHCHDLNSPAVNLSPFVSFAVRRDANSLILGSPR
jgi:hypothetical protein